MPTFKRKFRQINRFSFSSQCGGKIHLLPIIGKLLENEFSHGICICREIYRDKCALFPPSFDRSHTSVCSNHDSFLLLIGTLGVRPPSPKGRCALFKRQLLIQYRPSSGIAPAGYNSRIPVLTRTSPRHADHSWFSGLESGFTRLDVNAAGSYITPMATATTEENVYWPG